MNFRNHPTHGCRSLCDWRGAMPKIYFMTAWLANSVNVITNGCGYNWSTHDTLTHSQLYMQTFLSVYNTHWPIHNSIFRPLYLYTRHTDPLTTLYAYLCICIQHPLTHSQLYMQTFVSVYKTHWPIHNSICNPLYLYTRHTDPFTTLYADLCICIQDPLTHSQLYMQSFVSV